MSGKIRLPNITGKTTEEQIQQMKSYLIQTVGELNWALSNVANGDGGTQQAYRSVNKGGTYVDPQEQITETLKNFNQLKGLIIKSADIVNAYYEEINKRLEGLYVAQSEYGTFVEKTSSDITANSTSITQNYDNIQVVAQSVEITKANLTDNINSVEDVLNVNISNVQTDLNNNLSTTKSELKSSIGNAEATLSQSINDTKSELESSIADTKKDLQGQIESVTAAILEVNAYIKTGLLYYDDYGVPHYGVEVGQRNEVDGEEIFNKYARFTSNKLSFYDQNDNEVAYISDRKLYITHVEVTGSFTEGGFVDTVLSGGSIVTKWVGMGE